MLFALRKYRLERNREREQGEGLRGKAGEHRLPPSP
jgi:hypothetical protein